MEKKSSSKFDFLKVKECPFCGSSYFVKAVSDFFVFESIVSEVEVKALLHDLHQYRCLPELKPSFTK